MKLYIVVRSDLPAGAQCAQACHALRAFVAAHPTIDREWFETSNNLVVLQAPGLDDVARLLRRAQGDSLPVAAFHEDDMGGELTAIALGPAARRLVSSLPLALRAA